MAVTLDDLLRFAAAPPPGDSSLTASSDQLSVSVITNKWPTGAGVDNILIGSGGLSTPSAQTNTTLTASMAIVNPNLPFMGALSGYAFYTGAPGVSAGSLQGGACQANVFMNGGAGQNIAPTVLGWEMLGSIDGSTSGGTADTVIAGQTTPTIINSVTLTNLIGLNARGPASGGSGSPVVTNAYSIKVLAPSIGTNRWSIFSTGRNAFVSDNTHNVVEIAGNGTLLQWSVPPSAQQIIGYASDGASQRVIIDTSDGAANRLSLVYNGGSTVGIHTNDMGASAGNMLELNRGGSPKFAVVSDGSLYVTGTATTTTPAAGGAGALPATPSGYLTLSINGSSRKIAYY